VPTPGVALFINAFNFPAWGLWEKAAPALLSGVPVIVKPATSTAWLTQRMVRDVVDAGVLPPGALSVVCGSSAGLMDQLQPFDVVSFTGSADTGALIRSHRAVAQRRCAPNIEADSLNSALLMPDAAPGSEAFDLLVREVVREMTVKSGQKCTAIRRVLVPEGLYDAVAEAIGAKLAGITVGNPRNESVRMGSLVSRAQFDAVRRPRRAEARRPPCCTTAATSRWSTPTRHRLLHRAGAARHARCRCGAAWCTTWKSSAPSPRCCPTATWTTPSRSRTAARARW
jgi:3,4-dehydroadipyl-CoA semialdehyde dehydrogenase